jgi:beta-glucosidase
MHYFSLFLIFFAASVFAGPLNLTGTVRAISSSGDLVENAVVLLRVNDNLIAYARTLSDEDGKFTLLPGKDAPGETTPAVRPPVILPAQFASYQTMDLRGRTHALNNLPQGVYVLFGKTESGKRVNLGKVYHKGGELKINSQFSILNSQLNKLPKFLAKTTAAGEARLIVRKTGYLPKEVSFSSFDENVGVVVLERDPLEARIDSVMALMDTADKIAQMTQPGLEGTGSGSVSNANTTGTPSYLYGSVLHGGDGYSPTFLSSMVNTLGSWSTSRARIPTYYGKDAVHGNAGVSGYTVFPHNIGLGATRDSALVREIGAATAKEMWAARIDLNFSPAISVARDARWGRTYESYGENPELHVQMGAAMVRGLQGERYDAAWRVTATAKHFLGDGGTTNGKDRGNTIATEGELRTIHLPGYEAVVEQGVLSVMASFNTIQDPSLNSESVHQHIDSLRMTGWLKTELGFDGYIISDWLGIANSNSPGFTQDYGTGSPQLTEAAVRKAINAGIDLAMEPGSHASFRTFLNNLVNSGGVSRDRIDDAVRRILRAKFRAGRMDNPGGPTGYVGNTANRASDEHRAIARKAVAKSQVLLKNESVALPLEKNANIHVFGSHHDDIGRQCGGWTISWQGVTGNNGGGGFGSPSFNFTTYGNSILSGMQQVSGQSSFTTAENADIIVYVIGEQPYAEWYGDLTSLNFSAPPADMTALAKYRDDGKTIVTVFVTGRPRVVPALIEASDAFLVAWLPGTEGGGVADVLFGDYPPTGKLPITWYSDDSQTAVDFAYGYGLSY